jgi:hypothetical protein
LSALPTTPHVTLSEALSWIAFGSPLSSAALNKELAGAAFGKGANAAQKDLTLAVSGLAVAGSGGNVELIGRFLPPGYTNTSAVKMVTITPLELLNYQQFDLVKDGLRFGRGLAWLPNQAGKWTYNINKRLERYEEVCVKRSDLMRVFSNGNPYAVGASKQSQPVLSEQALKKWWGALPPKEKALSHDTLLERCRAGHPNHRITRQRIRDLAPGRKRGQKPITP